MQNSLFGRYIFGAILGVSACFPLTTVAQVFTENVIIQGNACAGDDCVSGESFPFTSLKLKETTTGIIFEDTSVGNFPTNDWQIVINSSVSSGDGYFGIVDLDASTFPFRIDAGAPSNAFRIDSSGRVGIGTSTPGVELQVTSGNSPTLRLDQDDSSLFAPQAFDIATNETGFFLRDVTNSNRTVFRIRSNAPSNAFIINQEGQVGIGTLSPEAALHIEAQGGKAGFLIDGGPTIGSWDFSVRNADGEMAMNDASTSGGDFVFKTADDKANTPWFLVHRVDEGFGIETGVSAGDEFALSTSGDLTITGSLTTGGPTCASGCDAVFDTDYPLPSIEDHAEAMFAKRYLPAIGPTSPDHPINLTEHMGNVLNELEKAHIYISQLNERNKTLESELAETRESFEARIRHLEAANE